MAMVVRRFATQPGWQQPVPLLVALLLGAMLGVGLSRGSWANCSLQLSRTSGSASSHSQGSLHVGGLMRHLEVTPEQVWERLLAAHGSPGTATVVEVGVFDGMQCRAAFERGFQQVHCFEPSPSNFQRSKEVLGDALNSGRVVLEQRAVANTTGASVVFHASGGTGDHAGALIEGEKQFGYTDEHTVQVETLALDDYLPFANASSTNPIYLMKIDTQGFDGVVLQGMRRLLAEQAVSYIVFELWPVAMDRATSCEDALELLLQAGYYVFETGLKTLSEPVPSKEEWFSHSTEPRELCRFYREHSAKFGMWTDMIAVAPGA